MKRRIYYFALLTKKRLVKEPFDGVSARAVSIRLAGEAEPLVESNPNGAGDHAVSAQMSQNTRPQFEQFVLFAAVCLQFGLARGPHSE